MQRKRKKRNQKKIKNCFEKEKEINENCQK